MHRGIKISILSLAAVVGVIAFAWRTSSTPHGPISLRFETYTNHTVVVTLSNSRPYPVDYVLNVERKTTKGWPRNDGGVPVGIDSGRNGSLSAGEIATLRIPVMIYAPPYPWRVSVFSCDPFPAKPDTIRFKAVLWLLRLNLPRLAQNLCGQSRVVQVSTLQVDQLAP